MSRDEFRYAVAAIFICYLTSDANPWKVARKQKIIREDVMGIALSTTDMTRCAQEIRRGR
jgi:hypothetical protein